ncbi:Atp-dependent zinc metalloprotease ftsh [Thalictrum thalictroides]|uniref:Peroxisomal ATPase PEX1 n=1 Tax=Thalictrum thalictroides TaxID=46969 RepID=A0A7J6WVM1_THATH|nr:Atp-dependent zinc metalloprotease ftsh [Thalictrum thalictroides]
MEFEVRIVGGIESCFVSLPLSLIQTLQSTRSGFLPPVLALELRSLTTNNQNLWHVAWSGSASSSSSAIEIAQQLADCISLPDHTIVQVRASSHLPKATEVTIEPHGVDDWEVMELNSEHAEEVILKQVGIVHEGMKFPLWVHGHIVTVFLVASTNPKNSVVQLVPGTEVVVAPKSRKRYVDSDHDPNIEASDKEHSNAKTLLRIQDSKLNLSHKLEVNNVDLSVMLTSVAFIHPETAKNALFDNLQLVVITRKVVSKESLSTQKNSATTKITSTTKETKLESLTRKEVSKKTVVHLIYSDMVALGHVMLPQSLRYYLRADLHSWVYAKSCNITPQKDVPLLTLSPCQYKLSGKENTVTDTNFSGTDSRKNRKTRNTSLNAHLIAGTEITDWSIHEELLNSVSPNCVKDDAEDVGQPYLAKGQQGLLHAWFIGQLKAIASYTSVEISSLVFGNETLLHFEVNGGKFQSCEKKQVPSDRSSKTGMGIGESPAELLYLLTSSELSQSGQEDTYELFLEDEYKGIDNLNQLKVFGNIDLGNPIYLDSMDDRPFEKNIRSDISSLSWIETAASDVIYCLTFLLSPSTGKLFTEHNRRLPGHVLIYGPSGSGKTLLANAVAKSFEEHGEILAHIVYISCSRLSLEKPSTIQQELEKYLSEARDHSPSLLIFDDLDSIVSSSSDSEGSQTSTSADALITFLMEIMDEFGERRQSVCGIGDIAFMACAQSLEKFPKSLSSSGRFNFHVQLAAPAVSERGAILKHEIHKRSLQCSEEILLDIAAKCDGYDAYDLEMLVDRAIQSSIGRFLSCSTSKDHENTVLVKDDFSQALTDFLPVSMRDITKATSEGGRTGWDEVGGLINIRNVIQEMIELPSKFPKVFTQAPLRLRSNVLLYGPPGCGKTHIVGAAAAACSLRFISVKGPELLNKYIGASEQAVRDIFSKAAAAAPCLLFFDEFDSIAPKRGHDNTGVTDRVVNQFLTELDGVESLTGVFVFAATSRPDLLDAALLRPGRFDRLLFCDFPSWHERADILTVLSRKLPLASDVNLDTIASVTEGFSGADLQALFSDAQLASVHELLESCGDKHGNMPVINDALLRSVASTARPSVSEAEKRRLYAIYSQFLDSKKSVASQSMDAKGKRATLA